MPKVKAVIELSEDLYSFLSAHGLSKETIAATSRKLLALKCYQERTFSLGKAAELAELSKWDFIEFASENGVAVIEHDEVNLKSELESAHLLTGELCK